MPRKKANGNITGARWQDIRLRGEIIAVNRRTGGLEKTGFCILSTSLVNRRTGGLEIDNVHLLGYLSVNRRTGGLEIVFYDRLNLATVNRRTGGLESHQFAGSSFQLR